MTFKENTILIAVFVAGAGNANVGLIVARMVGAGMVLIVYVVARMVGVGQGFDVENVVFWVGVGMGAAVERNTVALLDGDTVITTVAVFFGKNVPLVTIGVRVCEGVNQRLRLVHTVIDFEQIGVVFGVALQAITTAILVAFEL